MKGGSRTRDFILWWNICVCVHKLLCLQAQILVCVYFLCLCVWKEVPRSETSFYWDKHKYRNSWNACKNKHSVWSHCKLSGEQHSSNVAGKFLSSSIFFSSSILTCHMSYAWWLVGIQSCSNRGLLALVYHFLAPAPLHPPPVVVVVVVVVAQLLTLCTKTNWLSV